MKIHHLGIAVKNIEYSVAFYEDSLGWKLVTPQYIDPIQKVKVCFMGDENDILYELIEPIGDDSPVKSLLEKRISLYHFCYKVNDIFKTIEDLTKKGFILITGPVQAVAFNGKKIAFLFNSDNLTIELVEE